MTFPGRRITLGRGSGGREGRESLLMNPEPSFPPSSGSHGNRRSNKHNGHDAPSYQSGSSYSSGGSGPFKMGGRSKNTSRKPTTLSAEDSSKLTAQDDLLLKPAAPKKDMAPADGVMHFVPAFDDSHDTAPDTSWDAILYEGPSGFQHASSSRANEPSIRRNAQSTVVEKSAIPSFPRRPSDAESAVPSSRSKGPRIARIAALFSTNKESKSKATYSQTNNKKTSTHNTTEATLPSSPSRSSSSGGYVGWPGTQDKNGQTVAIQTSYEDSDPGPNARSSPFHDNEPELERQEMDEWMNSSAFQDISGVLPEPPSPPGRRPDNSSYFEPVQQPSNSIHINQLFQAQSAWDVDDSTPSPSRSSISKNSSAYFDNDARLFPAVDGHARRKKAAAVVMRGVSPRPPTEESLAINNSFSPAHRTFHTENVRGYRGLIDKTHDVPNLMDEIDSDSMASSSQTSSRGPPATANGPYHGHSNRSTTSTPRLMPRVHEEDLSRDSESDVFDEISKYSIGTESEPFDGLSQSVSKQSSYESSYKIRDLHPYEGIPPSVVEESKPSLKEFRSTTTSVEQRYRDTEKDHRSQMSSTSSQMKVVLLGGGLTTIQTTTEDFSNRITASDYDDCLTNSDIDEYGHTKLPNFQAMAAAGRGVNDSASAVDLSVLGTSTNSRDVSSLSFAAFDGQDRIHAIPNSGRALNDSGSYKDDESAFFSDFYSGDEVEFDGDLSEYYVQPALVKKLVRKYRKMCRSTASQCQTYDELDRIEDEKKAFALFEMRSRIMEKDIERGLERRGGTSVVDDLVTTPFNRRAMRIRDAVIVSKAWRDGATPADVINTANLTQRAERSFFTMRANRLVSCRVPNANSQVEWERVEWIDDADFMQYCCPSLGARNLRGSEMFTIGDCQSILLKLTNESCIDLRAELNDATARQIEAEEAMKEEGDYADGMMTEAEMTYLTAMEEVKNISKQLVVAEKGFALVRDRIKNLVAKYESLLAKIDKEDMATSSVITADSSCFSDEYASRASTDYDEQERAWYRRQQRAEISAELAAREALLAKQGVTRMVQEDKHLELKALQTRLDELQSEPSTTDRQRSVVLAKAIAARQQSSRNAQSTQNEAVKTTDTKVDDVKQRFRERMAARMRQNSPESNLRANEQPVAPSHHHSIQTQPRYYMETSKPVPPVAKAVDFDRQKLIRSAGEEMFQHLDFYERSLKAVELKREGSR